MPDKVMSPPKSSGGRGASTARQVKSSIIEGPTANTGNLNPFHKEEKRK